MESVLRDRADHHFYHWFAIAALGIVAVGFARTYYPKLLFDTRHCLGCCICTAH